MSELGKANKIKDFTPEDDWYAGTALYHVEPPISFMLEGGKAAETSHVIVAFGPETVDYGQPETKCFAADANGEIYCGFSIDDMGIDLKHGTFVGAYNAQAALNKLGYDIEVVEGSEAPPNYILNVTNDAVIAADIQQLIFHTTSENTFVEKDITWQPFFKYSSFRKIELKPGHEHFGCRAYQVDGTYWNADFSAKNGRISMIFFIEPNRNTLLEPQVISEKLTDVPKVDKTVNPPPKAGCFAVLGCCLVVGAMVSWLFM